MKSKFRSRFKYIDLIILSTVFLANLIHIWSWVTINPNAEPRYVEIYDLQYCLIELLFSTFMFCKAYRFKSCTITKIAVWLYLIDNTFTTMYTILMFFGIVIPYEVLYYGSAVVIYTGISMLFFTFILNKLCNRRC